jgi:photosystem II stability/assembly factor-like uncharacterized protein
MKRLVLLIALSCFFLACDRYPDPSFSSLINYYFTYENTPGKRFLAGEWVDDTVKFFAVNNISGLKDPILVKYEVVKGGGTITVTETFTNKDGIAATRWKLGTGAFNQILRANTYNLSGKYLSSSDLFAYGFRTDEWDTCTVYPDGNMTGMMADTVNKVTFMVTNNTLYRQGDRYYLWEEVTDQAMVSPRTLNIDRNGVIYVSTWNGAVLKSYDHGESWKTCTKPYPDRPYFIYISVSNDNYVWVFDFDHPTRFSRDGGVTWIDAGSGLSTNGFGDVFRLKDGSLLFHGSNCCSLNRSFDDGLTWSPITTPGMSVKLYVNDKDEIFIVTQENGISIYKSTDYGATFNLVHNVYPEWGTSMDNTFNKWGSFYYILIPGYGIMKSVDLTHYDDYWLNTNLRNLFIDHNGVLIGKDMDWNTVYYRKNSN